VDLVTRKLFGTLLEQLIHWFSSNTIAENPGAIDIMDADFDFNDVIYIETMAMLNSCFDAACQEDGSLSYTGARAIREFLIWTLKHSVNVIYSSLFHHHFKFFSRLRVQRTSNLSSRDYTSFFIIARLVKELGRVRY
jgi:hypothetical protein